MLPSDTYRIWDIWLADDGETFRKVYLQCPKTLRDPDIRYPNVLVGHAISIDLTIWSIGDEVFRPDEPDTFGSQSIWARCISAQLGKRLTYRTGISTDDESFVQRIGVACSADLYKWENGTTRYAWLYRTTRQFRGAPLLI